MAVQVETFGWRDAHAVLRRFADLVFDPERRWFAGADETGAPVRVVLPLVLQAPADVRTAGDAFLALPDEPGQHLVILLQAGAVALGWFAGGAVVATKSDKKYVVRGRGKAQPTHLATKGKSRYGSRLRLQNARALLEQANVRMRDWVTAYGEPDHVFFSCPVRLWNDLLQTKPPPPFDSDTPRTKIPLDLPVPTSDVLLRCYKTMGYGRIERVS